MKIKFYPGKLAALGSRVVSATHHRIVAECGQSTSIGLDEATAQYFAATPDLFEALLACQAAMRAHEIDFCQAYKAATAAIKKANGDE